MYTGRCLCGDICFEYDGPIGPVALCHCSQCRRAHGSAFSASAPVQKVGKPKVLPANLGKPCATAPTLFRLRHEWYPPLIESKLP